MEHTSNPAGRLWLFTKATLDAHRNSNLRATWQEYLDVDAPVPYFRAMAEVLTLPGEIKDAVAKLTNPVPPASLLLRPVDKIESVIASDMAGGNQIAWFASQVNDAHLNDLETCSYVLMNARPVAVVGRDELENIRALAEEIVDGVLNASDLDDEVREELLRYAHRLIQACDLYRVRGAEALKDELDRFVSAAHRQDVKERVPTSLWDKVNRASVAVLMAVQLFTMTADVTSAIETYQGFLELPASVEAPSSDIDPSSPTT